MLFSFVPTTINGLRVPLHWSSVKREPLRSNGARLDAGPGGYLASDREGSRCAAKVVCCEREKRRGGGGGGWSDELRQCSMPRWSGAGLGLKEQRWARNYFWGLPDLRFFNLDANLLACRWSKAENWVLEAAADLCGHGKHGVGLIALSRLSVGTASRTKTHVGTRLRPTKATHLSHRPCYRRRKTARVVHSGGRRGR